MDIVKGTIVLVLGLVPVCLIFSFANIPEVALTFSKVYI